MPRLDGISIKLPTIPRPVEIVWRTSSTLFRIPVSLDTCSLTRACSLGVNLAVMPFFRSSSARSSVSQSEFFGFLPARFGTPFADFCKTADLSSGKWKGLPSMTGVPSFPLQIRISLSVNQPYSSGESRFWISSTISGIAFSGLMNASVPHAVKAAWWKSLLCCLS
jgi:hypothetical protein